jgi:carbon-monoxide dehydrogenase medium subunit
MELNAFFGDHRKALLEPGEILAEIVLPEKKPSEGAAYEAFGLRASNFITVAGVAAYLRTGEGRCLEARLALGAVGPTPFLVPAAGEALVGTELTDDALAEAGETAADAAAPISDIRGSAGHRRELVMTLSSKALRTARERAR